MSGFHEIAVAERTRTYGTLRALGANPRQVRRVVLGEAIVIGAAGGALGVGLSALLLSQAASIPGLNGFGAALVLSPALLVAMLALSAVIGLLSGLTPAVSAYRANITSMLRQV